MVNKKSNFPIPGTGSATVLGLALGIHISLLPQQIHGQEILNRIEVGAGYIDNIGLASAAEDQMSDTMVNIEASRIIRDHRFIHQTIFYGLDLRAVDYQDYPCDELSIGLQLGYEKKLGLGFYKPRISISWQGSRNIYDVSSLNGYSTELSLRLSRPINQQLDMAANLSKNWEIPDNSPDTFGLPDSAGSLTSDALNQETTNISVSAEYYANQRWSFPASLSYLDGDLASIARLRAPYLAYADAVANDVGLGPDWFVYRSDGSAWTANIAASRLLQDGSQLNIELEYTQADLDADMNYDRKSIAISWAKNW